MTDEEIKLLAGRLSDYASTCTGLGPRNILADAAHFIASIPARDARIRREAREAMREPTPGMIAVGVGVLGMPWSSVIPPGVSSDEYVIGMTYTAMIDAASAPRDGDE